jgi:transposase
MRLSRCRQISPHVNSGDTRSSAQDRRIFPRLRPNPTTNRQFLCNFGVQPRWLPGYAPELDPVEFVWTQAKYADLANWIPQDIDDERTQLTQVLEQYRHDPNRLYSFFRNAGLPI